MNLQNMGKKTAEEVLAYIEKISVSHGACTEASESDAPGNDLATEMHSAYGEGENVWLREILTVKSQFPEAMGETLIYPPNCMHRITHTDSTVPYERFYIYLSKEYLSAVSTADYSFIQELEQLTAGGRCFFRSQSAHGGRAPCGQPRAEHSFRPKSAWWAVQYQT